VLQSDSREVGPVLFEEFGWLKCPRGIDGKEWRVSLSQVVSYDYADGVTVVRSNQPHRPSYGVSGYHMGCLDLIFALKSGADMSSMATRLAEEGWNDPPKPEEEEE
jgi:hypothetical protein